MTGELNDHHVDPDVVARVCDEYTELPGLQLTAAQASRLLAIDRRDGQVLLDELVETGFLRRDGAFYVRARW